MNIRLIKQTNENIKINQIYPTAVKSQKRNEPTPEKVDQIGSNEKMAAQKQPSQGNVQTKTRASTKQNDPKTPNEPSTSQTPSKQKNQPRTPKGNANVKKQPVSKRDNERSLVEHLPVLEGTYEEDYDPKKIVDNDHAQPVAKNVSVCLSPIKNGSVKKQTKNELAKTNKHPKIVAAANKKNKRVRETQLTEQPGKKISIRNFTLTSNESGFGFKLKRIGGYWFVASVEPKGPAWKKLNVNDCIVCLANAHGAEIPIGNETSLDEIETYLNMDNCYAFRIERYV